MKRSILALLAAVAVSALGAAPYPSHPVRAIVTTVPGPLDTFARMISSKMATALKQPFVIENRPGAGGNVGADLAAKSRADGYTLLFTLDTTFTVNPALYKSMPFDVKDFAVIAVPLTYGQMLAVNPSVPATSVGELVGLARRKQLNYASGGYGSPSHLSFAYLLAASGVDINHVPYKGTGQSIVDVVGGHVDSIFAVTTGVYPHVKSGKLRALAVSTPARSPLAPRVPTVAESGFPGFDASFAYALLAPAGTPQPVIRLLAREVKVAMAARDVQEANRAADYAAMDLDPLQSAAWLEARRAHWARVVQRAGIVAE